jgi:release factor glutamine methyltransferase
MGLQIHCDPRALIPRPETELLVETVLASMIRLEAGLGKPRIVDIGTGTGCVALALARAHPEAEYTAVDRSPAALELARENAHRLGMDSEIRWCENHLLDGFEAGRFDAAVANLPYISTRDWQELSSTVRDHEPRAALDSGPSGMELIEELAMQARKVLRSGGQLFLEFGFDQGEAVNRCLREAGYRNVGITRDLQGHERIAAAVNP